METKWPYRSRMEVICLQGSALEPIGLASSGHKITGIPTSLLNPVNNVAEYNFTLICTDPDGAESEQDFSILIYMENNPPSIRLQWLYFFHR